MAEFILSAFADEASPAVDAQIAALKVNGLTHLEPRNVDGKNVADLTADEAKALRKRLDDAGIGVSSVGSPLGKIGVRDDFEAHMEQVKRCVETACILGTENVRMFSFYIPAGDDPAIYRDEVIDRVGRMVEAGRPAGVRMCHENEKGIYGDIAARCRDLLDALPDLYCVFDPANFIQCGQKVDEGYALLKDRITYFHVKDAIMETGAVVPAGKGDGCVAAVLRDAHDSMDGKVFLTLEPHLTVFDGLAALEQKGGTYDKLKNVFTYPTNEAAFKAASDALHEILGSF